MINFFKQIINSIVKFDDYTKQYAKLSEGVEIPALAYTNWGLYYADIKNYDEAIRKLQTAVAMSNQNPKPCVSLAILLLKLKRYDEAVEAILEAIRRDSQNSYAYTVLSSIYTEKGEYEHAENELKKAAHLSPSDSDIYLNFGILYRKMKKPQKAIEMLRKSKMMNPCNEHTYFVLGSVLYETDCVREALTVFHQLHELNPLYPKLNYKLAQCYYADKDYEEAYKLTDDILKEENNDAAINLLVAKIYIEKGMKEKAFEILNKGEAAGCDSFEYKVAFGNILFVLKRYEEAAQKYAEAIEKNGEHADVYNRLANCYFKCNKPDKAEENYNIAYKLNPLSTEVLSSFGMFNYDKGDYEKALSLFEKSISISKKETNLYFYIANCYYHLRKHKKAAENYEKVIEYYPEHKEAMINCAMSQLELQNNIDALRKIRNAYRIDRESEKVLLVYALCALNSGLNRDAIEKAETILEKNPENRQAKIIKVNSLINTERYEAALEFLNTQDEDFKNLKECIYLFCVIYKALVEQNRSAYNENMLKYYLERVDGSLDIGTDLKKLRLSINNRKKD